MWYFSHRDDNNPEENSSSIRLSLFRGLFYHFGSICLGGLILAFIDFIRAIMEAI